MDPILVMDHCPRDIGWLVAAASMKRRVVGTFARALNSIPVARPQDMAIRVCAMRADTAPLCAPGRDKLKQQAKP